MDDSPLLRLPAEIREAIYILVLGENEIHVRNSGPMVAYSLCTIAIPHREAVKDIKSRELDDFSFPAELEHCYCATNASTSSPSPILMDLSLLWTCRQIHHEASEIPFKTNTFVCSTGRQLRHFANSLSGRQRELVTRICLVTSSVELPRSKLGANVCERRLSGVRRLVVVLGIANKTKPREVKGFLEWLEGMFDPGSMVEVEILVRFRWTRKSVAELTELHRMYTQWTRETEQALLVKMDRGGR